MPLQRKVDGARKSRERAGWAQSGTHLSLGWRRRRMTGIWAPLWLMGDLTAPAGGRVGRLTERTSS